jgi:coenzyme F420-0:L-glutamate ligase / coenzyme F420-1:gamma-L-glutamate ligase
VPSKVKKVEVIPLTGIPEVGRGDDLVALISTSLRGSAVTLQDGDVVVVKHKIVSKAEGRVVKLDSVVPGRKAKGLAKKQGKDPRLVELMLAESVDIVRAGHGVIITRTKHGFVCANSGIDQSNVGKGSVALLPVDPDGSARELRKSLEKLTRKKVAVVITDTFGRPWRLGQTDVAIGCSGVLPLVEYAGRRDKFGYELRVTEPSVVDEIAGAAELAIGKLKGIPAAVVRGAEYTRGEGGVKSMLMPPDRDLFR